MDSIQANERYFHDWKFGTINIRTVDEKSEGAKLYMITKEVARAGLTFCCMQEVRYRNTGSRVIRLDTGEEYNFFWSGNKKRHDAGVEILIQKEKIIIIEKPDFSTPRFLAINLKIFGFNVRVINAYSPTNIDGSPQAKDEFYRMLRKASVTMTKHQTYHYWGF